MIEGCRLEDVFRNADVILDDEIRFLFSRADAGGGVYSRRIELARASEHELVCWERGTAAEDLCMEVRVERLLLRPYIQRFEASALIAVAHPETLIAPLQEVAPHAWADLLDLNLRDSELRDFRPGGARFVGVRVFSPKFSPCRPGTKALTHSLPARTNSSAEIVLKLDDERLEKEGYQAIALIVSDLGFDLASFDKKYGGAAFYKKIMGAWTARTAADPGRFWKPKDGKDLDRIRKQCKRFLQDFRSVGKSKILIESMG